jgi:cytochrome c peroxidase
LLAQEKVDRMVMTAMSAAPSGRRLGLTGMVLAGLVAGVVAPALADPPTSLAGAAGILSTPTLLGEAAAAQRMGQLAPEKATGTQKAPSVIPQFATEADPSGAVASYQPDGATATASNAFFQALGSNGRSCFTCHQPRDGWTLSVQHINDRFNANPDEPLFRRTDAATCPTDDVSTLAAKQSAYSLLLGYGLIRIGLPMPAPLQYMITGIRDPYGCNTNAKTGLTSATTGTISTYRRPLPAANLGFLSTIMWDGREPDLFSQAVEAALIHERAASAPDSAQQQQMVTFEGCSPALTPSACANTPSGAGIFAAQNFDTNAQYLDSGGNGGPVNLAGQVPNFFLGINDPFGGNPEQTAFDPNVFDLFDAFANFQGGRDETETRQSIARGEVLFNTFPINITGVAGLNDVLGQSTIVGTCSTCHDNPDVGNHSVNLLLDTGVTGAGPTRPPILLVAGLPIFSITCTAGPLAGQKLQVTDPGLATITGNCADLGKVKVPILRGLAARAPYFHNGSAPTLRYITSFYNQRFGIGLSDQQADDLIAFLNSL